MAENRAARRRERPGRVTSVARRARRAVEHRRGIRLRKRLLMRHRAQDRLHAAGPREPRVGRCVGRIERDCGADASTARVSSTCDPDKR